MITENLVNYLLLFILICSQTDYQLSWNLVSETAALATALRGEIAPVEGGMRGE